MKKTTIELPDDLMKRVKLRALRDGKKLKDTVTELLQEGLAPPASTRSRKPTAADLVPKHLPTIRARPLGPTPAEFKKMTGQEMSDFIKDIEMQSEIERHEKALGHQYVDRADDRKPSASRRRS